MKLSRADGIAAKKERKRIKKAARALLIQRFGINGVNLGGMPGICRYITHYCPELAQFNGFTLLYKFVGEAPRANVNKSRPNKGKAKDVNSDAFLASYEWRKVRMEALVKYGSRCQCCGATPASGVQINVDHIKPRKKYPELALDVTNLQVLCEVCNHGKGNWNETDWRAA